MKLWQRFEQELEQIRHSVPGGPSGWRPERLIFRDWWHWKDQEFGFAHGRLALTGQNAGGKSSLLALTLPLLLDGRTEPSRLDPAQSRDRFLHYYLLGADDAEAGNPDAFRYETRIGYVLLEFYHATDQRYLTVGCGVSASRNSPRRLSDWWGFLLLKGQRIGRDTDVRGNDDACLGRRDFVKWLGEGGLVTTERGEYQRQVNRHLFGMDEDDYQALIEMLLQARRPKLGEQTGPDKVCDMLRRALPGVPGERLTRVGEVVNNLEEYRRNLEDVSAKTEAVLRIDSALLAVAEALVQASTQRYGEVNGRLGSVVHRLRMQRDSLTNARNDLEAMETAAAARASERAARQAEQGELLQGEGTDLQERLQQARDEVAQSRTRTNELEQRLGDGRRNLAASVSEQERLSGNFTSRTRQLAREMDGMANAARQVDWQDAALDLGEAARATEVLNVADPADLIESAPPGAGLSDHARRRQDEFRQIASTRQALDAAQQRYQQVSLEIEALRQDVRANQQQAENARDMAERRAEDLIDGLRRWQEQSESLHPSDVDLMRVAAAIRDLRERPAGGLRSIIEPLTLLGDRRREEIDRALTAYEERMRFAQLRQDRAAEQLTLVIDDPGDPTRSPLREVARPQIQDLPLFRQARFRAHISVETAALVEAAVLEAGWLDLLVAPTDAVRTGDAYLLPTPLDGPSLLDLLEPELGAPPEVEKALASIGWGEDQSEHWVSADGQWQNGPARGRVAPWAPSEAGFFGTEARERRRASRIVAAQADVSAAQAEVSAREQERNAVQTQRQLMGKELRDLETLPWEDWFDAMASAKSWEVQYERVRDKLEASKPRLGEAEHRLSIAAQAFDDAATGLPGAAALPYAALLERAGEYRDLALKLDHLLPLLRELSEIALQHRSQMQAHQQQRSALNGLEQDAQQAQNRLSAAVARVALLEAQVKDPAFQTRINRLQEVRERLRELDQQEQEAVGRRAELQAQARSTLDQIALLEPEESDLRSQQAQRLEHIKERLRLHVQLTPLLQDLEKSGPVAVLPRLPRPAEGAQEIEMLINQRKAELIDIVRREMDLLRDYRPTWGIIGESLTLYEERIPLAPYQLYERLKLRRDEYEGLIAEEQRKLFQDIIYEGILDELRKLIRQAREFTRRTNEKLKALRLSNGEELSLRLSPLSPEQAPGARIAGALEQMEQGHHFLPEEKREVLLSTIKDEVERVRGASLATGQEMSYNDAVAVALDYRNWYEYQIMSKMPGASGPVPIRTRGFGRRSNSAKAWALAVPVLAAVAARYDASPRVDLPRLIGLDEAFAGLDTNNQENYLSFLTQLDFSWIITVPDEVPYSAGLSAVMTYRMTLEGNFHTGFPILWNGENAFEPLAAEMSEVAVTTE